MSLDPLFRPFHLRGLTLPNRIVMAPMTRGMAPDGIPGKANGDYYRRRAEGEVGLVLTEGTVIDRPASRNLPGIPFFHGKDASAGWADVVSAVHAAGGKIGPQIWHTGSTRAGAWEPDAPVESPSGLVGPDDERGIPMSDRDVADTIAAFAQAAENAKKLGFDVVEIHGAHGYLVDQFFWGETNLRTDRFGGSSIQERSRFALEVVKAVRAAVGPDFPVLLRVSQWKQQDYSARLASTPDEMRDWLLPLVEAGVDILHCSQRRFWEPEFAEHDPTLNFAGWAKKLTGAATISVGSVGLNSDFMAAFSGESSPHSSLMDLVERMDRDEFDLIAVGRVLISDPAWVRNVRLGHDLRGFHADDLKQLV